MAGIGLPKMAKSIGGIQMVALARSKEIYDPESNAWYWIDSDGTMAHDKDVYLRSTAVNGFVTIRMGI